MTTIEYLENTIEELEQSNAKKSLIKEYKNAVLVLKGEKVRKCTLKHVINDMEFAVQFDGANDFSVAIEKLKNASA